ncbi:MAG: hypothetical protein KGL35_20710 [Bradyrhizobium sp.]|nr:hypothetical protein [Bradyrhizobium sp.]
MTTDRAELLRALRWALSIAQAHRLDMAPGLRQALALVEAETRRTEDGYEQGRLV